MSEIDIDNNGKKSSELADYICVQALNNGVSIIGMTRGAETRFHHTEKLDKGEVCVMQFTKNTSAIKIRGNAKIYTRYGVIETSQD